jgi:hypothetical protein
MKMLKFTMCMLGAIVLSLFFFLASLFLFPSYFASILAFLILVYLYWPKKRWLFSEVLGPVFLLGFLLSLTISLIIL